MHFINVKMQEDSQKPLNSMVHWNGSDASFSFKEYNKGFKNKQKETIPQYSSQGSTVLVKPKG